MRISDWSSDVCSSDLIVDVTSGAALKLDPPKLPDLTRYTAETAIAKIRKSPRGHAEVRSMLDELSFKGFMGRDERMRDWAARQRRSEESRVGQALVCSRSSRWLQYIIKQKPSMNNYSNYFSKS